VGAWGQEAAIDRKPRLSRKCRASVCSAIPGLAPSFRRSLPETGGLSQGLPHGHVAKQYRPHFHPRGSGASSYRDSLENAAPVCALQTRDWHRVSGAVCRKLAACPRVSPTDTSPNSTAPIFIPADEVLPHTATLSKMPRQCVLCNPGTGTEFPAQFAGNWLPVPGFAPRDKLPARVSPKRSSPTLCVCRRPCAIQHSGR
jgi:hypothetical protein